MMETNIYALYKGDSLLATGTIKEIADTLGISERTVRHYQNPAYHRRTSSNSRRLIMIAQPEKKTAPEPTAAPVVDASIKDKFYRLYDEASIRAGGRRALWRNLGAENPDRFTVDARNRYRLGKYPTVKLIIALEKEIGQDVVREVLRDKIQQEAVHGKYYNIAMEYLGEDGIKQPMAKSANEEMDHKRRAVSRKYWLERAQALDFERVQI